MDSFYPRSRAASKLEEAAILNRAMLDKRAELTTQHLASAQTGLLLVKPSGYDDNQWILCSDSEEDGAVEEAMFRVQGILTENKLVPRDLPPPGSRQIRYLAQHAELCGLETETFAIAKAKIAEIKQRFAEHLCNAVFQIASEKVGPFGSTVTATNRFFTCKRDAPTEQDGEFEDGVDPMGVLSRLKTEDLIHAAENRVKYFKLIIGDENTKPQYVQTGPGSFKVGDVVEMQMSFIAIKMNNGRIKITHRLQALSLLSDVFTKEGDTGRANATTKFVSKRVAIRRKVGYFYEDEEEARAYKKVNHTYEDGESR
ncbi:hypothetical protein B0H13DRAFT_2376771 [Mycena leptocephala]|nr:hypothetical protein B0H13DRAFT_2376771 [Mycena leptocephala]